MVVVAIHALREIVHSGLLAKIRQDAKRDSCEQNEARAESRAPPVET
jgi:hypothetical protein